MSCCNRTCCNTNTGNDKDIPDSVQPCCGAVRGRRCFCLPYDDPWMISSQVLAIIAVFFSWVWWVTSIISVVGLFLFQLPWCCRQNGGRLYGSAVAAGVTALVSLGAGIYVLVNFRAPAVTDCLPFTFWSYKYINNDTDYCREEVWATVAFVCSALWSAAIGCLVYFVKSGRHAKWEKQHSGDNTTNEVELEAVGVAATEGGPVFVDAAVVAPNPVGKFDDV